jgi:hypothetical protein
VPEPGRLEIPAGGAVPSHNQQLANTVADRLRQSPTLKAYRLDVLCRSGVVELTGEVQDASQAAEVERLARSVSGVREVINLLVLRTHANVVQAQILQPPPIEGTPPRKDGDATPPAAQPPLPVPPQHAQEPTPIFQAQPGVPNAYNPPKMPPYAWPTYAPYNNYSRVGYPTLYPYQAWPFIGPIYPFPKVPLGWRSVSLTWQDGFWWYGRNATGHNWWQLRFW